MMSDKKADVGALPEVAGLEWCDSLAAEIEAQLDRIPLIELIPENFFPSQGNALPRRFVDALARRPTPVMVHSVGLSLASIEPLKEAYLDEILAIADALPVVASLSDHLCMTEMEGSDVGQLTSAPYNEDTLDALTRKVEALQRRTRIPFAIENITHNFLIPDQPMSEAEIIRGLVTRTGARLLLDLNNIYTNGVNFGLDPYAWLDEIELEWVEAIHLAGGFFDHDHLLQDGHCARVPEPVWTLYEHVIARAGRPIPTIVERTGRNREHGLRPVLGDQERAQTILHRYAGARSAAREASLARTGGVHP
jgi:uncharacterized protein (UPF0276 family)